MRNRRINKLLVNAKRYLKNFKSNFAKNFQFNFVKTNPCTEKLLNTSGRLKCLEKIMATNNKISIGKHYFGLGHQLFEDLIEYAMDNSDWEEAYFDIIQKFNIKRSDIIEEID